MKYIKLSGSGQLMPIIGLGTWQATAEEIENAVISALKLGYRHIGSFNSLDLDEGFRYLYIT